MLSGAALKALSPQATLQLQRGRCLRHRLSTSGCRNCFEVCAQNALSWTDQGLHWNEANCSGCLLCAAGCPTEALSSNNLAIGDLLTRLSEVDKPVLACSNRPETLGHARVHCLGLLADPDMLLILQLALGKELRLNLTACGDCENQRILVPLLQAVEKIPADSTDRSGSIHPVTAKKHLDYQEKSCTRREFFGFLNHRSRQAGVSLVDRLQTGQEKGNYGNKTLPLRRRLALQLTSESSPANALVRRQLLPELTISENCNGCTRCIGICPTGALQSPDRHGEPPAINLERCIGCRLCSEFCKLSAISLTS